MATAGRRVSESESSECSSSSSSSDDSLLTDTGQLSLQPYMHEPPATYRRKVDKSASQHTDYGPGYGRLTQVSTVTQSMNDTNSTGL